MRLTTPTCRLPRTTALREEMRLHLKQALMHAKAIDAFIAAPASLRDIATQRARTLAEIGTPTPESVETVWRACNGLKIGGLTIWPARSIPGRPGLNASMVDASAALAESFSDQYLYLGNLGGSHLVKALAATEPEPYQAIHETGHKPWITFQSHYELLSFALADCIR